MSNKDNINNSLDFDEAMKKLEAIADELGKENVSLDKALKLYEEGVKLVRNCNDKLAEAERCIKILQTDSDGVISEKTYEV